MQTDKYNIGLSLIYFKTQPGNKTFSGAVAALFILLFSFHPAFAFQLPVDGQKVNSDSTKKVVVVKDNIGNHKFGRSALLLGFAEVVPWSFDRYLKNADYARISFSTVGHNLKPSSWEFDNDNFQTNQIGHPYQGNLFFNAFRSNGYTFWQSVPASFAGSYIWETVAEKQPPAPNDFINTGFGGAVLGEMTFRMSNKIINNRARGFKRQVSEILGLMVDPQNGLNRILNHKWGKVEANPTERDSSKINAEFDLGGRQFTINHNHKFGWYGHVRLIYGTPYEDYRTPFSNITVNAEFGQDDSSKVNVVSVYGSLAGWGIGKSEKNDQIVVLSANYDYINNVAFFYSGESVRINLFSSYDVSNKVKINTAFGVGAVILGAVPDAYYFNERSYDYGTGASITVSGGITIVNKLAFNINYRGGWIGIVNGNASHYFLNTATAEVSYQFIKNLGIAAEPGYFNLRGYYKDYPDLSKTYPYLRLSARYSFNL